MKRNASNWRTGTKRHLIASLAEAGKTKREAYQTLRPMVESQTRPMVFSANVGGHRRPKALAEQLVELKNEIGRVYAIMGRASSSDFESEEIPEEESENNFCDDCGNETILFHHEESGLSLCADCIAKREVSDDKPRAKGKHNVKAELERFRTEVRRLRKLCIDRAATSAPLDWISMRPAQAASKLIPAGIPAAALLHAMVMHWKPEIRREAGVPDFDFVKFSREVMESRGIDRTGKHELFGYALILAEERQPIMLIGPAGTGKSFLARQLADHLELPYGETPMTPGATRGDLLGRMTANSETPFILSQFAEIYSTGGVFNFEEIDAADPGMLLVLNNALAGETLFNSANGQKYERHSDFIAVATANTFGTGANRDYTGREKLDSATLDRWRMGRLWVAIDESVEDEILFSRH